MSTEHVTFRSSLPGAAGLTVTHYFVIPFPAGLPRGRCSKLVQTWEDPGAELPVWARVRTAAHVSGAESINGGETPAEGFNARNASVGHVLFPHPFWGCGWGTGRAGCSAGFSEPCGGLSLSL